MFHTSKHIDCDICGTLTETKVQDIQIPQLGKIYLLENATVEVCPNCGEMYVPGKTNERFKKLVKESPVTA